MTEIEILTAIEEIKRLFASRIRAMDMKLWDLYASCHTHDIVGETYGDFPAEHRPAAAGYEGILAMIKLIRETMEGPIPMVSCHHAHTPEIELTGLTEATGIWAMEDHLWWEHGQRKEWLHGYGHYFERYRKVGDKWLISYRRLTRLRLDRTPGFYDRWSMNKVLPELLNA